MEEITNRREIRVTPADPVLGKDSDRIFTYGSSVDAGFWQNLALDMPHLYLADSMHMCSNTTYLLTCAALLELSKEQFQESYLKNVTAHQNIPEFIRNPIHINVDQPLYYFSCTQGKYVSTGFTAGTVITKPGEWGIGHTGIAINNTSHPSTLIVRKALKGQNSMLILERILPEQKVSHATLDQYIPSFRSITTGYKGTIEKLMFLQLLKEQVKQGELVHESLFRILEQLGHNVSAATYTLTKPI